MARGLEHSDKFLVILGWLYERSPIQIGRTALSAEVDVPERTLSRYIARMETLGLIVVHRTSTFGVGPEENRYTVLVTPRQWQQRARATLEARRRDAERERARRQRELTKEAKAAVAAEEALAEMRAMVEALDEPDPVILALEEHLRAKDFDDEDVIDAWLGGML